MWKEGSQKQHCLGFLFSFCLPPPIWISFLADVSFIQRQTLEIVCQSKKEGLGTKIVFSPRYKIIFKHVFFVLFCISQQPNIPESSFHSLWDIFLCVTRCNRNDQSDFVNFHKDKNLLSLQTFCMTGPFLFLSFAHPEKPNPNQKTLIRQARSKRYTLGRFHI